jgi:WD40 repeat protein
LYIIDLEAPYATAYTLHHQTKWDVTVVKCSPHSSYRSYVASTSNHNALIWNINRMGPIGMQNKVLQNSQPLIATLRGHTRPVSDLSWSPSDPMILATCSADTKIHLWDIRTPKSPVQTLCGFSSGATQIEWNKIDQASIATAHDGEVRVWDTRSSEKTPVVIITAHMQKINGIDWHPRRMYELVTCSEDKTVKLWNVTQPRTCQGSLTTGASVWRTKFTPFGNGLVTISHRLDNTLRLWALSYSESSGINIDQVRKHGTCAAT